MYSITSSLTGNFKVLTSCIAMLPASELTWQVMAPKGEAWESMPVFPSHPALAIYVKGRLSSEFSQLVNDLLNIDLKAAGRTQPLGQGGTETLTAQSPTFLLLDWTRVWGCLLVADFLIFPSRLGVCRAFSWVGRERWQGDGSSIDPFMRGSTEKHSEACLQPRRCNPSHRVFSGNTITDHKVGIGHHAKRCSVISHVQ